MSNAKQVYTDTLAALTDMGVHARDARELMDALIHAHMKPLQEQVSSLEADSAMLHRLYAAGVDNWSGFELAIEEEEL